MDFVYRFPWNDADSAAQVARLLSGAGAPTTHPDEPGNWCLAWNGTPRYMHRRVDWIALAFQGHIRGWVRFCHSEGRDAVRHFGDPPVRRVGYIVHADRWMVDPRLPQYPNDPPRSHYLPANRNITRPPGNGQPYHWVDGTGTPHTGCYRCGR